MSDFLLYFKIGWQHIISWDALDHILFITALSAIYLVTNWKQVLILVTAFTVGHSLTLALSVYDIIRFDQQIVEFLIPCTILATCLFNFATTNSKAGNFRLNYLLTLVFGLIHGMGFANTIRFMLVKDQNIAVPLISFNIGIEAGQVVVVSLILLISYILVDTFSMNRKWWIWGLSGIALLFSLKMLVERWPG